MEFSGLHGPASKPFTRTKPLKGAARVRFQRCFTYICHENSGKLELENQSNHGPKN